MSTRHQKIFLQSYPFHRDSFATHTEETALLLHDLSILDVSARISIIYKKGDAYKTIVMNQSQGGTYCNIVIFDWHTPSPRVELRFRNSQGWDSLFRSLEDQGFSPEDRYYVLYRVDLRYPLIEYDASRASGAIFVGERF